MRISTIQDLVQYFSNLPGKKQDLDAVLPFVILPILLMIATISRIITSIIMVVIGMGVLYVYSRPRQKNRSPFFFSWTISSCITMLLVFEFCVVGRMIITQTEHFVFIVLLACTWYFFYQMKAVADFVLAKGTSKGKEYSPVLTSDSHYCQICQIEVNDRFFHSIWWDCCVLRPNYVYFLAGHIFGFATLLFATNLGLTTVCQPFQFYEDILFLPGHCDYVYSSLQFDWILSFVTCVYGMGYLFVTALVLTRQMFIYIPKHYVKNMIARRKTKHYEQVSQQEV